jgi:hypothetical protein
MVISRKFKKINGKVAMANTAPESVTRFYRSRVASHPKHSGYRIDCDSPAFPDLCLLPITSCNANRMTGAAPDAS